VLTVCVKRGWQLRSTSRHSKVQHLSVTIDNRKGNRHVRQLPYEGRVEPRPELDVEQRGHTVAAASQAADVASLSSSAVTDGLAPMNTDTTPSKDGTRLGSRQVDAAVRELMLKHMIK
jgi:hypothetical protein